MFEAEKTTQNKTNFASIIFALLFSLPSYEKVFLLKKQSYAIRCLKWPKSGIFLHFISHRNEKVRQTPLVVQLIKGFVQKKKKKKKEKKIYIYLCLMSVQSCKVDKFCARKTRTQYTNNEILVLALNKSKIKLSFAQFPNKQIF